MSEQRAERLFQNLLGADFQRLPAPVRALHDAPLPRRFRGRASVTAAQGTMARLIARVLGFPRESIDADISVSIEPSNEGQGWLRDFPPRPMRSRLWPERGLLCERFGPVTLRFRLRVEVDTLAWQLASVHLFGLRLPLAWFGDVEARESVRDGRYHFFVRGALPGVGHLIGYEGWLDVD
jgi:hypothetical protein